MKIPCAWCRWPCEDTGSCTLEQIEAEEAARAMQEDAP